MNTLVRPLETFCEQSVTMPRQKRNKTDKPAPVHQMSVRIPDADFRRIETAAAKLGLDATSLVRMILKENLATYEQRAEQVK